MQHRWWFPVLNLILLGGLWVNQPLFASEVPKAMTSIAPFHALVSAVMDGIGEPKLLLTGKSSPHHYTLRPSEIKALQDADIIFWGGPLLETFLAKPLTVLPPSITIVELDKTKRLKLLKVRQSALFAPHTHDHSHGSQEHEHPHENAALSHQNDMHFWLDPDNAKILVDAIAQQLSNKDPVHQTHYLENAKRFKKKIEAIDHQIKQKLQPVQHHPFIVFHDAYQYFERHYGLTGVAAISLHPEIPPSVERLKSIREILRKTKAICIFSEPQFKSNIVQSIAAETNIRVGQLDPLGRSSNTPGNGYLNLLNNLSDEFSRCLYP